MKTKHEWEAVGLKKELDFHKRNKWRQSDAFMEQKVSLYRSLGVTDLAGFENLVVLDAGCGSKLSITCFEGARLFGIDPLARNFLDEIEWSDLGLLEEMYSVPLEEIVPELIGRVDLIVCINVIDHGTDWKKSVENMLSYLKDCGQLLLYVDVDREEEDEIHSRIRYRDLIKYIRRLRSVSVVSMKCEAKGFDKGTKMAMVRLKKVHRGRLASLFSNLFSGC